MKSFLYQINKRELEENIEITSFSINEKQDIIEQKNSLSYQIYLNKKDFKDLKLKENTEIVVSKSILYNKEGEKVIKLNFKTQSSYSIFTQILKEKKIRGYEQDLPAEHRYLIENPVKNTLITLKYLSVDIETLGMGVDSHIILLSTYSPSSSKQNNVYIDCSKLSKNKINELKGAKYKNFNLFLVENEKKLLLKFKKQVLEFKPQIMLGWNLIDFDLKIIKNKMDFHSIDFRFTNYDGDFKLRINTDFFKDSTLIGPGMLFFDVIALLRTNFIVFEDYKLNTVAKKVLGEEKINIENDDVNNSKVDAIKNLYYENPVKLAEYNFKDSKLTSQIVEKLKLLELMQQRSLITKTPLSKVKSPIASLDIMYLEELHKENLVANTNFSFAESSPIEGAFVITPEKGFYKNIFVYDFKSLYPSIIMTFNLDPFSWKEIGQIIAPNGAKFEKKAAILPRLIKSLYKERDIAKKENNKTKSFAIKTTMNSFYGAVASPKCRFYNKNVGEAITGFGRHIIQKAKKYVESKGHFVVYGDTDSIFVKINSKTNSFKDRKKEGEEFEKKLNSYFNSWVEKEFKQENYLNIELEKMFSHFFIASKKRYVGYDEISKQTLFIGMEAVRGDWTPLARNFQKELVDLIFSSISKSEIEKFILKKVEELKSGKYDDFLRYKKKITKDLTKYTKMTPPHVKAARELENFTGRTVYYIMTKEGPKHISLVLKDTEYDYDHYIDKQLHGVSDDLLESIGIDFKDILYKKKQKGLDSFF